MDWGWFAAVVLPAFMTAVVIVAVLRRQNDKKIDFPVAWQELLRENASLYRLVPASHRSELHRRIIRFINDKNFEGCGGIEITDEIQVLIAFHAALLLLNKTLDGYPLLHSVLVYPTAFNAEDIELCENQYLRGGYSEKTGESWQHGDVILAWDAVREESRRLRLGRNSAIHEFAHQLDQDDGAVDGIPVIHDRRAWQQWRDIMKTELTRLRRETAAGITDVIDQYGAMNEAEFFAIATETFFCMAPAMSQHHPRLYRELRRFYRLDPRRWHEPEGTIRRPIAARTRIKSKRKARVSSKC